MRALATAERVVATGSVTQANMRISAVDGTAFVDFSAAGVLTNRIGNKVRIKDSSGRAIVGYIKAAGTGETLAGELFADTGFDAPASWITQLGWTVGGSVATKVVGNTNAIYQGVSQAGWLVRYRIDVPAYTSGTLGVGNSIGPNIRVIASGGGAGFTTYLTMLGVSAGFTSSADGAFSIDNASVQRVTEPSATGATIVSTKGGSTFNWTARDTNFNYNDSSGYTYQIIKVMAAPVVASGSVNAGDGGIVLTDGSAVFVPVGQDITAYAGGYHLIAVYDSSNQAIHGFSGSASGGTGLTIMSTLAGATQNWFNKTAGFDKDVALTYKIYYAGV